MIGKTIIKLVWIFLELDLISKLKPVRTYLLTGFNMKNKFSPENVLIRKTFLEVILSVFLKYIVLRFYCYAFLSLFYYYHCFSNFYHCFVAIIILRSLIYYFHQLIFNLFLIVLTESF